MVSLKWGLLDPLWKTIGNHLFTAFVNLLCLGYPLFVDCCCCMVFPAPVFLVGNFLLDQQSSAISNNCPNRPLFWFLLLHYWYSSSLFTSTSNNRSMQTRIEFHTSERQHKTDSTVALPTFLYYCWKHFYPTRISSNLMDALF